MYPGVKLTHHGLQTRPPPLVLNTRHLYCPPVNATLFNFISVASNTKSGHLLARSCHQRPFDKQKMKQTHPICMVVRIVQFLCGVCCGRIHVICSECRLIAIWMLKARVDGRVVEDTKNTLTYGFVSLKN